MNSKKLIVLFITSLFLVNCAEDDNDSNQPVAEVCDLPAPIITNNSPVTEGSSILLETPYVNNGIYYWTGPNNFVSYEQNPIIPLASPQTAGTYSLQLGNEFPMDCVIPTATTVIAVVAAVAPCNPTNNTASNTVFPTMTFNSVLGSVIQDQFEINANGSYGDLTLTFKSDQMPAAGQYAITSNRSTFDMAPNGVNVSIVTGGTFSYYYVASTGVVFLSYVNGHLSATFCNVQFTGPDGGTNFASSAKVTTSN